MFHAGTSDALLRVVRRAKREAGFTLVELMIVVAIIAVLAIIAVVGYRKMILSSHTAEGTHMIGSIRVAQETFHSETGQYYNISNGLTPGNLYPNDPPDDKKLTAWGVPCGTCADPQAWNRLPVHPDGPVRFGYATIAGVARTAPGVGVPSEFPSTVQWPAANNITSDWYVVSAYGDLDGNGKYVAMMGTSWMKDLFIANEGE
jgi:type IV pilus assembly protein PilA